MVNFTYLFPFEKLNFKEIKLIITFKIKAFQIKIYKQTKLIRGFKTASKEREWN
jgi:hypothetical protein